MTRIAVLDDYQSIAAEFCDWSRVPGEVEVVAFTEHLGDEDAVAAALQGFQVVVAMRERTEFRRSLLERLPDLRLLVTTGMRNKSIDVAAAAEHGITVCGTGSNATATVELAWALILAAVRHIPAEDAAVRAGGWQQTIGTDLAGARLGVVGLGRLGSRVAAIGQAFGMDVVAWSQNLTDGRAAEVGVRRVERDELFATADVITIHLLLSKRTRGLIGADDLALMKHTAVLVNTSRGPIVQQQPLLDALTDGRIGGAALDVYDSEPLPADSPLRTAPRTVLTPHLGYVTRGTYGVFYGEAVDDVAAWVAGSPVRVIAD
ncbi:D-2-hydroxyacid dehydrogenase family protein [Blastococcus sp. TF02-8]|uniref:D-2-hydroxyacid dehydrogenase family protein n=1 Tax=Blastococcus sp. TF02-8 TaxID=2250574 RepID=UPI000DE9F82A|nr:D-2-hydroxyacid dehydrogenase family protein [Blastococcus sp. TF02-8]RBY97940.1 D-2-hydroxyacid dehydrogenase family protein [Blastococcus sp. TF02-8]